MCRCGDHFPMWSFKEDKLDCKSQETKHSFQSVLKGQRRFPHSTPPAFALPKTSREEILTGKKKRKFWPQSSCIGPLPGTGTVSPNTQISQIPQSKGKTQNKTPVVRIRGATARKQVSSAESCHPPPVIACSQGISVEAASPHLIHSQCLGWRWRPTPRPGRGGTHTVETQGVKRPGTRGHPPGAGTAGGQVWLWILAFLLTVWSYVCYLTSLCLI